MWDEIAPDAQAAHTREQLSRPVDLSPQSPGIFHNFGGGIGTYFMRSMAEAGRGLDLLGSVVPIAHDAIVGGTANQDQYFKEHDDVFGRAVDYWTPKPGEVGAAGEVLGSVSGNLLQFTTNPVLALNTAQMGVSEDLVKQGVNAPAAVGAGTLASLGLVAGIKIPIAGKTLAQRVATGVAGNVGQGVAQAAATHTLLKAAGAPEQVAAQFDPWDLKARTIDTLMGAAFGVAAHIGAPKQEFTQQQKDALMLVNQARHLEDASSPGRPATEADLTKTVAATRQAIDQMLRGEPVQVEGLVRDVAIESDPSKRAQHAEAATVIDEALPKPSNPIEAPKMMDTTEPQTPDVSGNPSPQDGALPAPQFPDTVRLPSGEFDPKTGEPTTMSANDYIAKAHAELADAKSRGAELFRAAAGCLLGSL